LLQKKAHCSPQSANLLQKKQATMGWRLAMAGGFFFFIFKKKLKFQKYMSVLKNFKNIPRSPYGGDRVEM